MGADPFVRRQLRPQHGARGQTSPSMFFGCRWRQISEVEALIQDPGRSLPGEEENGQGDPTVTLALT